jgi:predicted  nucleic acid-binding Zn-ribbon protein
VLDGELQHLRRDREELRKKIADEADRTRDLQKELEASREETSNANRLIDAVYTSETWKVGLLALGPIRGAKRLLKRQ